MFTDIALYRWMDGALVSRKAFNAGATLVVCFNLEETNLQGDVVVQMEGLNFVAGDAENDYNILCSETNRGRGYVLPQEVMLTDGGSVLPEGLTFISIEATDMVGNRGIESIDNVDLDFTPPQLVEF